MYQVNSIIEKTQGHKKLFAVLIDPDDIDIEGVNKVISRAESAQVDLFFLGGSLLTKDNFERIAKALKSNTSIPVIIFPGSVYQISSHADAILFLSLISGRNPEYLIGQQVQAAPHVKASGLEVIPTGYMLIDSGKTTTALYMSNTTPIPRNKPEIAATTALAGKMMGNQIIYLDAGSGADNPVSKTIISAVKKSTSLPLIVGGGLKTEKEILDACSAGADIIVVGNMIEKDISLIETFANTVHSF